MSHLATQTKPNSQAMLPMKLRLVAVCGLFTYLVISGESSFAQGQLHKCVSGDGKATYTDQPCSAKNGERSADSNDQAIRKIQAVAQTKNIGKTCWTYAHRASQCENAHSPDLRVLFRETCSIPAKSFEDEQNQDQRRLKKNQNNYEEVDDLEYSHRFTRKSRAVLKCESLDNEMWEYLNLQFPQKISTNDRKLIEHQLKLIPDQKKNDREPSRNRISISPKS